MYIKKSNLIFIHIPKTAGNFLQNTLINYSEDEIIAAAHADGDNRFNVKGQYTRTKHAKLMDYEELMPSELFESAKVLTSVRHPVERMLSLYFSPHANISRFSSTILRASKAIGLKGLIKPKKINFAAKDFSHDNFAKLVSNTSSMSEFFSTSKGFSKPDFIIRKETLRHDIEEIFPKIGFTPPLDWTPKNKSSAQPSLAKKLSADQKVIDIVRQHHAIDFEQFGYK